MYTTKYYDRGWIFKGLTGEQSHRIHGMGIFHLHLADFYGINVGTYILEALFLGGLCSSLFFLLIFEVQLDFWVIVSKTNP